MIALTHAANPRIHLVNDLAGVFRLIGVTLTLPAAPLREKQKTQLPLLKAHV
jgi:hypothetical protein